MGQGCAWRVEALLTSFSLRPSLTETGGLGPENMPTCLPIIWDRTGTGTWAGGKGKRGQDRQEQDRDWDSLALSPTTSLHHSLYG